jgi:hypothetical protein
MVLVESGRRLRERRTRHVYDARLSGVHYSTKLFAEKCGYLLARKVGFGCFCFASSGAVSSFGFPRSSSRSLLGGGKEELEKHQTLETKRTEEQKRQKRDTFLEIFP